MSFAQSGLAFDSSFAKPHHLCRCCKRLAEAFVRIHTGLKKREWRLCPRYDDIRDLTRGAQEGCHLCIITMEDLKQRLEFDEEPRPTCLQLSTEEFPDNDDLSEVTISTYVVAKLNYTELILKIRQGLGTQDETEIASFLEIKPLNPPPAPKVTIPTWIERARLSNHIGTDEHFQLIRMWMDTCTDELQHPTCNTDERYRRPTRLLDLTAFSDDVRLVEGARSDEPYAALSYCWGLVPQLMLLHSNLESFRQRMPLARFSQVAQDAIAVCRKLSIRYLWVDALCIIQGKDGDFSTEAPRMRDVYGGSILTIVAASSKDTTEPFLTQRNPLEWLDCNLVPVSDLETVSYWVTPDFFCEGGEPGDFHIDSRAWCLQERLMSPRCIYFGQKGMHWECRHGVACEVRPVIKSNHMDLVVGKYEHNGLKSQYAELHSLQPNSISDVATAESIWRGVVRAYSEMGISHIEDKLVAIAGVASVIETKFNWTSTYGLWTDLIIRGLLWHSASRDSSERDRRFTEHLPSWSWTSSHGHTVLTEYPKRPNHAVEDSYMATAVSWPANAGFSIFNMQRQEDKRLCIRGLLVPCKETWTIVGNDEPNHHPPNGTRYASDTSNGYTRMCLPDPDMPQTDLFCLLLLCQKFPGDTWYEYRNHGLVLTSVDTAKRCYRRVGMIMEDLAHNFFPDAPSTHLVDGKFLTDMWTPVGDEQEVFIV